jgi:hypothetical protein
MYLWRNPQISISVGVVIIWILAFCLVGLLYYVYSGGVDGFTTMKIRQAYSDAERHVRRFNEHLSSQT